MSRGLYPIPIFLFILLSLPVRPQNETFLSVDTAALIKHVKYLASDSMQGRNFGTPFPGLNETARYIASRIAEAGLEPFGDDYFQLFTHEMKSPGPKKGDTNNNQEKTPVPKVYEAINVAGYIRGHHPVLQNECIVYMAHYDHLGLNADGIPFNGADDNASGTAALIEIARAFQHVPPDRTVVFLWFTAEESGLYGSDYYVNNPLFPLEQTIAAINLDMVGRVYELRDSVWKKSHKQVKGPDGFYLLLNEFSSQTEIVADTVSENLNLIPDKSLPRHYLKSSDHYHFHRKEIPVLNLSTGYHADYHKITDDVSRINFEKLRRMTELSFRIGAALANDLYKNNNQK